MLKVSRLCSAAKHIISNCSLCCVGCFCWVEPTFIMTCVTAPYVCVCALTSCVVSEMGAGCSGDCEDLIVVIGGTWAQCSTGYKRPSVLPAAVSLRPWPRLHLLGFITFSLLYCTTLITPPYTCTHMNTTDNADWNTSRFVTHVDDSSCVQLLAPVVIMSSGWTGSEFCYIPPNESLCDQITQVVIQV